MARKIRDLRILRDERVGSRRRRPGAGGQPVHAVRRRPQGPAADLDRGRAGTVSEPLYDAVCAELERLGTRVERGVFGAMMQVSSVNDGPFTVLLERGTPFER